MRLHPLIENRKWVPPEVELIFDRNTMSLDLKAIDSNMKVFDPKARNKVEGGPGYQESKSAHEQTQKALAGLSPCTFVLWRD